MDWAALADDKMVEETARALRENGFEVLIAGSGAEAREKALALIPKGAEVFTASSVTNDTIGLNREINESGSYRSVRKALTSMDRGRQGNEMKRLGSAPEWMTGSVHAVTMDGKAIIASASGSQLPGYSFGSSHVIWVVGTQKIVKDLDEGMRRIYEYVLPLEKERAMKAYGKPSSVSKLLVMQKEQPGRVTIILAKERLGF